MRLHRSYGHGLKDLVDPEIGLLHRASRARQANEMRKLRQEYWEDPAVNPEGAEPVQFEDEENASGMPTNTPKINKDGTFTYGDVTFDPRSMKTFFMGLVSGLQFNNNTYGKCFYIVTDTLGFADYFQQDFANLFVTFNFYQLFVYDTVHVTGNLLATYE